jgi:hypothetical protein
VTKVDYQRSPRAPHPFSRSVLPLTCAGRRALHRFLCSDGKNLIELAFCAAEAVGIAWWCHNEGGPSQTCPHPGKRWQLEGHPTKLLHESLQAGTASMLTLVRPAPQTCEPQMSLLCPLRWCIPGSRRNGARSEKTSSQSILMSTPMHTAASMHRGKPGWDTHPVACALPFVSCWSGRT